MAISMLKIRRPLGRLIFNMGIAIPGKTVFLIETAPRMTWYEDAVQAFPVMEMFKMLALQHHVHFILIVLFDKCFIFQYR